jgi:protein O-GlcNAc transferase
MRMICEPFAIHDSSLDCSDQLRFCRGRNLMINFTDLIHRKEPFRWQNDVLKPGDIGGFCKFNKELLDTNSMFMSSLQSWAPELTNFKSLDQRPIASKMCDVVIEKPTFIMKLDSTINMYHHFCDFFNLYAAQHVNFTHPNGFSTDVHILIWETFSYWSPFSQTFEAFTENPILNLNHFSGNVVCFKNVVFPLLPRMIYGLFYNTPIVSV